MSIEIKKGKFINELKSKLNQKCYGNTSEETVLVRAFKYFDLDNSGKCSKDEFLKAISKIGITGFSDNNLGELFTIYDVDNSGEIDYKEFVGMLYSNNSISNEKKILTSTTTSTTTKFKTTKPNKTSSTLPTPQKCSQKFGQNSRVAAFAESLQWQGTSESSTTTTTKL